MTIYSWINDGANVLFGAWFALLGPLPEWLQIVITALPVTAFALLVFRWVSNQAGIRLAKDRIKAHLLELWLYKDDPRVLLGAQARVIGYSLRYLGHSLLPLLVMAAPVSVVLVQIEARLAWRGLAPGEAVILTVTLADPADVAGIDPALQVSPGLVVETPALRIADRGQVLWRLRADAAGEHIATVALGTERFGRRIVAGESARALAPAMLRADDWMALGYPGESPLPAGAALVSIEVDYPRARGEFFGLSSASWLLFGATLVLGFALRGAFGVTF